MKSTTFRIILLLLLTTIVKCDENSSAETNEIDVKAAVSKIDPKLRQALLRAIDKLEQQNEAKAADDYEDEPADNNDGDEDLEESTTSDELTNQLKYHSPIFQKFIPNSLDSSNYFNGEKIIHKTSEKNDIIFVHPKNGSAFSSIKTISETYKRSTTESPVSTTTTTRKPAPTHNEDGENIEVVNKQDIKIFEAPLVTAFTVQQDSMGTPKKVIPISHKLITEAPKPIINTPIVVQSDEIAKNPSENAPTAAIIQQPPFIPSPLISYTPETNFFNQHHQQQQFPVPSFLNSDIIQQQQRTATSAAHLPVPSTQLLAPSANTVTLEKSQAFSTPIQTIFPTNTFPSTGLPVSQTGDNLNNLLFERQRRLEEQILLLQSQSRQQQEQILIQQQLLQDQQRKRYEEQTRNSQSNNLQFQTLSGSGSSVEIVPAQTNRLDFNPELQLPVRDAVNFQTGLFSSIKSPSTSSPSFVQIQPSKQFSFSPQTNLISSPQIAQPLEFLPFQALPQKSFQTFNVPPLPVSITQSATAPEQGSSRTRVFRHESGTGNFGVNNQLSNSFFRPAFSPPPPPAPIEGQLQNYFFHSALNHGVSQYTPQNFHFSGGQFRRSF